MLRKTTGLALAGILGAGLAFGGSAAWADDNSKSDRKDRVEDQASATKDRIDDNEKAQKKAIEERADRDKAIVEKRSDREKDNVDKNAKAEKAAIDRDTRADVRADNRADNRSDKGGAKEEVTDAWITTKIKSRFVGEKALKGSDISVDTDHTGEVTLTGTAPSKKASQRAFQLASTTKGVRSVNNQVVVSESK